MCSVILHTRTVIKQLYNPLIYVAHCCKAPETIVHLLVECELARMASSKFLEKLKVKLDKLSLPNSVKAPIWFEDVLYKSGKIQPRNVKRTPEGTLEGLMGKEGEFKEELLDEMKLSGKKRSEEENKIRRVIYSIKRFCIKALYKIYNNSVAQRSEILLVT